MHSDNQVDQETAPESAEPGFGERLRAAREALGLTQAQAAERLHCDPTVVVALESEDVVALGAPVYARGHLRRYAELLGLPAHELVALHDRRYVESGHLPNLASIPRAERPRDPNKALRWVYIVAAGLIGLFAVWAVLQSPRGARAPSTAGIPNAPGSVANDVQVPATSSSLEPVASGSAPAVPTTAPAPTPPAATGALPSASAAVERPAPAPDKTVRLRMQADGDCWTEVYDFEGRQLYFDTARRGVRHQVSGIGPLRVVLGNAAAMRFEVDGREVRVPESLQRKGTAFLNISADGRMERAQ